MLAISLPFGSSWELAQGGISMCLFSRERETRQINVGESAVIGKVDNFHGDLTSAVLPKTAEKGIACLCVPNGYVVQLSNLPASLTRRLELVSTTAKAIFREGGS